VDREQPHKVRGESFDENPKPYAPVLHRSNRINQGKRALRYDKEFGPSSGSYHVSIIAINDSIPNSY
jgi:hypothetical protein